jgi:hypothetical protein
LIALEKRDVIVGLLMGDKSRAASSGAAFQGNAVVAGIGNGKGACLSHASLIASKVFAEEPRFVISKKHQDPSRCSLHAARDLRPCAPSYRRKRTGGDIELKDPTPRSLIGNGKDIIAAAGDTRIRKSKGRNGFPGSVTSRIRRQYIALSCTSRHFINLSPAP